MTHSCRRESGSMKTKRTGCSMIGWAKVYAISFIPLRMVVTKVNPVVQSQKKDVRVSAIPISQVMYKGESRGYSFSIIPVLLSGSTGAKFGIERTTHGRV